MEQRKTEQREVTGKEEKAERNGGGERGVKDGLEPVDKGDDQSEDLRVESGCHGLQTLQSRDLRA